MKRCKIENCNGKYVAKDYCSRHYQRFKFHGDPLYTEREFHGSIKTPEYSAWNNMKDRCSNPNYHSYQHYGGRGITVCDKWRNSFVAFFADMGKKPFPKAQMDRIDNNKGYYKENCHWVSCTANNRNQTKTKLTEQTVQDIREIYQYGNITQKGLGLIYRIGQGHICRIIHNKMWQLGVMT